MSAKTARVIPYVEDRRNCLLFKPEIPISDGQFASLQSAIKNAIQVIFQLEDNELATEPLPDMSNRKVILLYESAEGGAGVLKRLIEDPTVLSKVAKMALELCHFDPISNEDLRKAPRAKEECEAACYYCLMNYSNQRDHMLLDRQSIRDLLLELMNANIEISSVDLPREDHMQSLLNRCDSELEKKWLNFLLDNGYSLPTKGQYYFSDIQTRADFIYEDKHAVVYIDGPHHDYEDRKRLDDTQTEALEDQGYTVIRFRYDEEWEKKLQKYSYIFGRKP